MIGTVVSQRFAKLKVYTLNKLMIIDFFLQDIIEWLRVLIGKINIVKVGLNCSNFQFQNSCIKYVLPDLLGPTSDTKMRFFVEITLFLNLVEVKSILLRCTRFPHRL